MLSSVGPRTADLAASHGETSQQQCHCDEDHDDYQQRLHGGEDDRSSRLGPEAIRSAPLGQYRQQPVHKIGRQWSRTGTRDSDGPLGAHSDSWPGNGCVADSRARGVGRRWRSRRCCLPAAGEIADCTRPRSSLARNRYGPSADSGGQMRRRVSISIVAIAVASERAESDGWLTTSVALTKEPGRS
jgi:hypothetical protein